MDSKCWRCSSPLFVSILLLLFTNFLACGGGTTTPPGPGPSVSLSSIAVIPGAANLALGLSQQFVATGTYSDGSTKDITANVTWTSSASSVATVNSSGLASSKAQGTATISASLGAVKGNAAITVVPAQIASIAVTPNTASLALGLSQQFAALGTYTDASTKDITANVTWTSSASSVATVSSSGLVSSKSQGTVSIAASLGTVIGNAAITVGPAQMTSIAIDPPAVFVSRGSVQAFTATGTFTDGSTQDVTSSTTWNVQNHYIASGVLQSVPSPLGTPADSFAATTQRVGFTAVIATHGNISAVAKLTVVSPSRFAYITNDFAAASLAFYVVDGNSGDLHIRGYRPTQVRTESNPPWTSCVTTDPAYGYAYVSNPGSGTSGNVRIYTVNPTSGAFAELSGSPFATSAPLNCIQFEPSGKFGYALGNWNGVNKLVGYSRDSTSGLLTELPWSPMTVGSDPTGLAIDPMGQYLYFVTLEIATGNPTAINGYSIDATTGALTSIVGMPIFVSNTTTAASVHPSAKYAYISHGDGNTVDVYSINRNTGALALVPGSTITTDTNPSALVFNGDGSLAYMSAAIGVSRTGTITTFRVDDATGKLVQVGNTQAGTVPQALTLDTSGQFLYVNDNTNYLRVYQLQRDGTPKYVRSIQSRSGRLSVAMVPGDVSATYTPASVFVTTAGDNSISGYSILDDGSLTLHNTLPTPASPNSLALLPWGTEALVAATAAPAGGNLATYSVGPLTGIVSYKAFTGDAAVAGGVALDPGEEYAFQSDSSAGVLRTYGRLLAFGDYWSLLRYGSSSGIISTFPAGNGAGPMVVLPSGRFVYVANQSANSITAFYFWGELFEATSAYTGSYGDGSPYAMNAKPVALAADPMGMYLFVACDDNTLRVYSIDSWAGGHLTSVASIPLPVTATSLAVDPSGHFIYVGDASGNISPFTVEISSGSLTALTPTGLDAGVTAISVESSGQLLYVLCGPKTGTGGNHGTIRALKVNADGTLMPLQIGPWPANNPSAIAFTDIVH